MTSLTLTDRLISDIEKSIQIREELSPADTQTTAADHHLDLIVQLLNLGDEPLIAYEADSKISPVRYFEEMVNNKEKIIRKVQHLIDEDPFVTMPDNQSIFETLLTQLELFHSAVNGS